jgi:hypothetical protein
MKILFAALHQGYYRNIESIVETLAARGHDIYLGHERHDSAIGGQTIVDGLASRFPNITRGAVPTREADVAFLASKVRLGLDYLRYLDPMFPPASGLRSRAEVRTPAAIVSLTRSPLMKYPAAKRLLASCLDAVDRAVPPSPAIEAFLDEERPDLVVVTPLIGLTPSSQVDLLRSAQARGIPTVVIVWSWDHLSSKAIVRDAVDGLFVWNEAQKQEAVGMHGFPAERVVVTGAQCFDKWFARSPRRSRDEFVRRAGLPDNRPYVLWACSALLPGSPPEPDVVTRWATALRNAGDPRVRDLNILIRPHPSRVSDWDGVDWRRFGNIAWFGDNPVDDDARDDYFDSLYHSAAVVGITTSAFLEAAIVDRPVMTIYFDDVRQEHEGSLHFQLLLKFEGGMMTTARTLDEHVSQLAAMVSGPPQEVLTRQRRFVDAFVRPHGAEVPATDVASERLEALGRRRSTVVVRARARAIGRWGLRAIARIEHHPRRRYWLLTEREAVVARRMDEKLARREEALAEKARQRAEKAKRAASRAR